ncbi:MAG TPA: hypothetical protein VJ801_05225 [Polyangia bacterium]|nr:hypothetical protein [Polyangia bacterium]
MRKAPKDGDDSVEQCVGSGGLGLNDVAPSGGEGQGGAHLGGAARGHAVQVKAIASSALGAFVEAHGNRAGSPAYLAAEVRVAPADRVEQGAQGQGSLQSEVVGVESGP